MAKIRVDVHDIAEDATSVVFNSTIDVIDSSLLISNQDGEDIPWELELTPKPDYSQWRSRIAAAALTAGSGPLAGIVATSFLRNGANELGRGQVRVRGLATTPRVPPMVTLLAAPTRIQNRNNGGVTLGISDSYITSDLPDGTVVRFVVYASNRSGNVITVRFSAISAAGVAAFLNGSEVALNVDGTGTIQRKVTSVAIESFAQPDRRAIRNARAFWAYTKSDPNARSADSVTVYNVAVSFDVPE